MKSLLSLAVLVAALAAVAADGIESDGELVRTSAKAADAAFETPHVKVTVWDLMDQSDRHNELVSKREWLLMPGVASFKVSANVLDAMETTSGRGVVFVRRAPLPHARADRRPDFEVVAGRPHVIRVLPTDYPCERIAYAGGVRGRHRALMAAERRWRACRPGRDGLLLTNTWGDRARDAHLCEKFMLDEIAVAAELGVDVVEIDDGWQKGRSSNSSAAKGKGVWNGYWAADPEFWTVDPVRFPNGLKPLADAARAKGLSLGLWFAPDSSNDAANWMRDADLIVDCWKRFGVRHFKVDSMKSASAVALARQRAMFDRVLAATSGDVTFDLDITAEIRPGYFGMPDIGPVYVENRYTDWGKYWPHQTLRNLWSLSEIVDPVRLRMEFLNLERNADKFRDDPLAPSQWTADAAFASVMISSPLGFFELTGLSERSRAALKPIVATWRRERDRLHAGVAFPVGARPDGISWTGFLVEDADAAGGYALLFRDGDASADWSLETADCLPAGLRSCRVLAGDGTAKLDGTRLAVSVPARLGYLWLRLER